MSSPSVAVRAEYLKIAEAWDRVHALSPGDTVAALGAEAITSLLNALAVSENTIVAVERAIEDAHPFNDQSDWTEYASGIAYGLDVIRAALETKGY